jgi:pyruvate/2-oxoglutarate/acetoin dehydrogenase E1 component
VLYFVDMALLHEEGEVPDDPGHLIPLGRAEMRRGGNDVTLVGYAKTVGVCEKAAAALAEQGVDAEVVDLRSLKPLDRDTVLASVRKTGRLVVVTEASGLCGVAAEITALAADQAFTALRAPVLRLTGPDVPAAASWALEQAAVPTPEQVAAAVTGLLQGPSNA